MKVSELIEQLKALPHQDAEVIMSRDPEGNGYSTFQEMSEGTVRDLESWEMEYFCDSHSDLDAGLDPGEREGLAKVICLWP